LFKRTETRKKVARPTGELVEELEERKYDKILKKKKKLIGEEDEVDEKDHGYNYLLSMQIRSITAEKINKLKNDLASALERKDELGEISEKEMYITDLDAFETAYRRWLRVMAKEKVKKPRKKRKNKV